MAGIVTDRGWEHFAHGADLGVCGRGPTLADAFEQAALALSAAVTTAKVETQTAVNVACTASDSELLFVEWLNAIIYEMAVRKMIFGRFDVQIADGSLNATLWGELVDPARHEPACEPKGATYTELRVAPDKQGIWSARCVVDV